MPAHGFDPEIVQDFLTESGELLEQLDQDLVTLEGSPQDPELLNKVFRALHTIKGSASFLALTNLVELAHAAEGALNAARNGVVTIDKSAMDLLLSAVDILRRQFDELREGSALSKADEALVAGLTRLAEGKNSGGAAKHAHTHQEPVLETNNVEAKPSAEIGDRPLVLSGGKNDLLDFFIADVDESVTKLDALLGALKHTRDAEPASELLANLARTAAFFEFDTMNRVVGLVISNIAPACELDDSSFLAAIERLKNCTAILREQCSGLKDRRLIDLDLAPIENELARVFSSPADTSESGAIDNTAQTASGTNTGGPNAQATDTKSAYAPRRAPLSLPENKSSLIEFLIPDLEESVAALESVAAQLQTGNASCAGTLVEIGESLQKSAEFFEFDSMNELAEMLRECGEAYTGLPPDSASQIAPRIGAIAWLIREQTAGLNTREVLTRKLAGLRESVLAVLAGNAPANGRVLAMNATAEAALQADGILPSATPSSASAITATTGSPAGNPPATKPTSTSANTGTPSTQNSKPEAASDTKNAGAQSGDSHGAAAEQTIRVEVGRLEALLNLVGELVLQKNRLGAIARHAVSGQTGLEQLGETLTLATSNLDRVTSDIQVAVMRTRMQPLDKLFGRYPRLIRDLARKTDKSIRLDIEGGDTEVDKSVIEELADPLVHLLRNSADHGLETPSERTASGKPETGMIKLRASHEGSHVLIQIIDDGRGLSRAKIGKRAVERGLVSQSQLDALSDREVWNFIFAPGFSTAEQVTDLSGRGVGMDVVRTNIAKIKGSIDLSSVEGKGTTISIQIPLTVAILTAMMVEIGTEIYAIPLSSIVEIVKPDKEILGSIRQSPVMRLRDTVLPLLEGTAIFNLPETSRAATPFAVVVEQNQNRVGLMVSRLIGQQEIVIKPLDGTVEHAGPISGATVRDDGGVSLIVDVGAMLRLAEQGHGTRRNAQTNPQGSNTPPSQVVLQTNRNAKQKDGAGSVKS